MNLKTTMRCLLLACLLSGVASRAEIPANAVWIDVRSTAEYARGHLEQAQLIPFDGIEAGEWPGCSCPGILPFTCTAPRAVAPKRPGSDWKHWTTLMSPTSAAWKMPDNWQPTTRPEDYKQHLTQLGSSRSVNGKMNTGRLHATHAIGQHNTQQERQGQFGPVMAVKMHLR